MKATTALVYATPMEAAPLLARLPHVRAGDAQGIFIAGDIVVAICGMGLAPAAAMVERLLGEWPLARIVNVGVAGALHADFAVGEVIEVTATCADEPLRTQCHTTALALPRGSAYRSGARLVSRDQPVFDRAVKARLAAFADLVDMEGHAIARACAVHRIECTLVKTVSDDATDRAMLLTNLDHASRHLAAFVLTHLSRFKFRKPHHAAHRARTR